MQKLDQIQKFALLTEGHDATFFHPQGQEGQSRLIKMRLNAPTALNLYITPVTVDPETGEIREHHSEDQIFLAHVAPGYEELQFMFEGSFCLNAIGGNVWLDTYDNTRWNMEASDPTSFARIFEREERHPAILEMERMARYNQELMRQQNAADMAAAIQALEKRMTANVVSTPSPSPTGKTGVGSSEDAPVSSAAAPSDPEPTGAVIKPVAGEPA